MAVRIILEIIVLWIFFAVYMAIFVAKRGPIGAAFSIQNRCSSDFWSWD